MTVKRGVTWLARGGYAARGVVYGIVGGLAMAAALGSGQAVGAEGALRRLLGERFGDLLLWSIVLGLLCFSVWRLTQALGDTDGHGRTPKGLLIRAGLLGSAGVHLLLAFFALGLLIGGAGDGGSGQSGKDSLQRLLAWDHANLMLFAVALVPLGVGLAHLIKAWTADFTRYFQADEQVMRWLRPLARLGLAARGCAFLIIAALLIFGGRRYRPTDPPGLEDALDALQSLPAGTWLLLAIGLGLLCFALYCFAQARWRRIDLSAVMPAQA